MLCTTQNSILGLPPRRDFHYSDDGNATTRPGESVATGKTDVSVVTERTGSSIESAFTYKAGKREVPVYGIANRSHLVLKLA
jgi:hypothetical protein